MSSQLIPDSAVPASGQKPSFFHNLVKWQAGSLIVLALAAVLLLARYSLHGKDNTEPAALKTSSVAVVKIVRQNLSKDLSVQAELRPYQEIDLHSKVAGFLQQIDVDIGDSVKAGQLLAIIEVPELKDDMLIAEANERRSQEDLKKAEAELDRADAAYEETHQSYQRLAATLVAQPGLIAQQDLDVAKARDHAASAQVATARASLAGAKVHIQEVLANINKLRTMIKYTQITAPFDGMITKRYADPGALIQAGTSSSTQAMPLVRVSQINRLRLVFPVSVSYVSGVKVGDTAHILIESAGKTLTGTISRRTGKVETSTRSMDVEVDLPNPDNTLVPGMYATVGLQVGRRENVLAAPIDAVSRREKTTVFVLNHQNELEEREVKVGLEMSGKIEILSGLKENDLVVMGNRTQLKSGQKVEPKIIEVTGAY